MTAALILAAAPAVAQTADDALFDGPYVGVQAGWGRRAIEGIGIDKHRSGVDYGAYAGYDARLGQSLVIGGQAAIGAGGRTLTNTIPTVGTNGVDPGLNWSVSGRAGVLVTPTVLVYGRAGYGREKVRNIFPSSTGTTDREWLDGLIVGGGAEMALSRRISVRAEYRYSDFDRDYNTQQALIGVSFRF